MATRARHASNVPSSECELTGDNTSPALLSQLFAVDSPTSDASRRRTRPIDRRPTEDAHELLRTRPFDSAPRPFRKDSRAHRSRLSSRLVARRADATDRLRSATLSGHCDSSTRANGRARSRHRRVRRRSARLPVWHVANESSSNHRSVRSESAKQSDAAAATAAAAVSLRPSIVTIDRADGQKHDLIQKLEHETRFARHSRSRHCSKFECRIGTDEHREINRRTMNTTVAVGTRGKGQANDRVHRKRAGDRTDALDSITSSVGRVVTSIELN
jgi:hypothetical protein